MLRGTLWLILPGYVCPYPGYTSSSRSAWLSRDFFFGEDNPREADFVDDYCCKSFCSSAKLCLVLDIGRFSLQLNPYSYVKTLVFRIKTEEYIDLVQRWRCKKKWNGDRFIDPPHITQKSNRLLLKISKDHGRLQRLCRRLHRREHPPPRWKKLLSSLKLLKCRQRTKSN